mmetsp:Transcript_5543/g.7289  ORF Transcript_5543/g.7289 Transcript_5543/m.7289 type:complete len:96 (-) Transcript_5543:227-514(-)
MGFQEKATHRSQQARFLEDDNNDENDVLRKFFIDSILLVVIASVALCFIVAIFQIGYKCIWKQHFQQQHDNNNDVDEDQTVGDEEDEQQQIEMHH